MGNIALQLKLVKVSLINQWRLTLSYVCLVSIFTTGFLIVRCYGGYFIEPEGLICRIICVTTQLALILILAFGILITTKKKLIGNLSFLKALVIIGVCKKYILFCLAMDVLLITVSGLCLGGGYLFLLQLSLSHEMLVTAIEVAVMVTGMIGLSWFAVIKFFRQLIILENTQYLR